MAEIKDPFHAQKPVEYGSSGEDVSSVGKPKRDYKKYMFMLVGLGVVVALLGPSLYPKKEKKVELKPIEKSVSNVAKDMEDEAQKKKNAPMPPPVPTAPASLKSPAADDHTEEKELLRKQSIIASGMESTEFNFTSGTKRAETKPSSVDAARANQKVLQDRLLANSDRVMDAALKGNAPAGETIGREEAFLGKHSKDSFEDPAQIHAAHRGHALYQGHLIRTVLLRGINSDLPGSILARVVSDVFDSVDGRILLIPKGTVIYGDHSSEVAVGQSRMLVATDRMIFPNGKSASLQKSTVSDMTGYAGLESKVDNHFFQMFGTSMIVGAASWLMPTSDQSTSATTAGGATTTGGSIIAQALGGTTKSIAERNKTIKPTLTVGQGEIFLITIGRDVILPEYIK